MILLDTNVISETQRAKSDANVAAWLNAHFRECAISSILILELRAGLAALPDGKRKAALRVTIDQTIRMFGLRVYMFDTQAAFAAGDLVAAARKLGSGVHQFPKKIADLQIAGIAKANNLTLATRNVRDFDGLALDLVNPWNG